MKKLAMFSILVLLIFLSVGIDATEILQSQYKRFIGLSTDTKSTLLSRDVGSTWYETDTGLEFIWTGSAWAISTIRAVGDSATLSAPGNTPAIYAKGYNTGGFLFNISNINTTATVILQGRVGNSAWTAIGVDSTSYSSNGGAGLLTDNVAAFDSLRARFESETGGTAVQLTFTSILARE